jgi:hypothetical protein
MNAIVTRIAAALVSVLTTFVVFSWVVSLGEPQDAGIQATYVAQAQSPVDGR